MKKKSGRVEKMSSDMEKLKTFAELLSTPQLAELVRVKELRKEQLLGRIFGSEGLLVENNTLGRELRALRLILQSRQTKMKGFF